MNKHKSKHEFKHKPFIKEEMLNENFDKLVFIENEITKRLKEYFNFDGIYFSDVSAGYIQVNGIHKKVKGYVYGFVKLEYDFSNIKEVIESFVEMWKESDNDESIKWYQDFLRDGERYGWE